VAAFVENLDRVRCDDALEGLPVLWVDELQDLAPTHRAVFGLGTTQRSRFTDQAAALGIPFATVIHPSAVVSGRSEVGEGTVIFPQCVVGARTTIGCHVLLNRAATVGHHSVVEDFVSIQPRAAIAGACTIGSGTWVGIGATVIDRTHVGRGSVIGAGAVVTRDVPDAVQVVGVPARVVKEGIDGR
jgi:sugar O-acyltransferase (sialic acid O-acetyltransferase NeuD family)